MRGDFGFGGGGWRERRSAATQMARTRSGYIIPQVKNLTGLVVLLMGAGVALPQSTPRVRMPENVAIFAVRDHGNSISIDPIVIVHYGSDQRFTTIPALNPPLPSDHWTDADFDKIETTYYKPGTVVSMFSGGERLGTATLLGSNIEGRDGGCVSLAATITYSGPGKPNLATNTTNEITGHASTQRAATPEEISTLRRLAIEWLTDYGLDKQLLDRGRMGDVVSTVLRTNAGRALIGRFDVESKLAIHRLFAIAEQDGGHYKLSLANLEIQHDVEDGVDKTEREYIDQLDINNDGVDEVIASAVHYEGWSYVVWKFDEKQKSWRKAFSGSGGGC
jgi:hypothetical protein